MASDLSQSPREGVNLSVPRVGTLTSQNKQCEKILGTMKAELISCSADIWLKTYSPLAADQWPQDLVNVILNHLRNTNILTDGEGWTPIKDSIRDQCTEDATFSCLEHIVTAIADAVINTYQNLAETRI